MIITHPIHQAIPKLYVCSLCTKESTVRLLGKKKKKSVCVHKAQPLPHKIREMTHPHMSAVQAAYDSYMSYES